MPGVKILFICELCIVVPGAYRLAVVTTKYPITHNLAELFGNRTLVFNTQVGDTAPRIKLVRFRERVGWAYLQTGFAVPAHIAVTLAAHR